MTEFVLWIVAHIAIVTVVYVVFWGSLIVYWFIREEGRDA